MLVLAMPYANLTVREIAARPVVLKLKRPVVARIATITEWPLILIDLVTEEGIVGRSYLEPYIAHSFRSRRSAVRQGPERPNVLRAARLQLSGARR